MNILNSLKEAIGIIKGYGVKIWKLSLNHKFISVTIAVAVILAGYFTCVQFSGNGAETRYVLAAATKGTIVASVSGSGQVSALNQVDINPKVSGEITYVNVKAGQEVGAGALLFQIDSSSAQKSLRDAQINLESANLSLEKLKQSSADLNKIYEESFNTISETFLDLPTIVSGAETVINGSTLSVSQSNKGYYQDFVETRDRDEIAVFISAAANDFNAARSLYDATLLLYKNTNRYASGTTTVDLLDKTTDATKSIAQALKSEQGLLDYLVDYVSQHSNKTLPALISTYRSNLQTYIGQVNNHLASLIDVENNIKNAPLDISSQELSVKQRQNALLDAQEELSNYYVRAPFGGIVAAVNAKVGDSASSGTSAVTLITKQKIAEIPLNEVDVAKVKVGQKATITFDAIDNLTVTGVVSEIDAVGTVTQGVVTYNIKIVFDTQDDRIKSGMSVSASIITDTKQDVLLVPNAAVKSQGGTYYIEIPNTGESIAESEVGSSKGVALISAPARQQVETGIAGDSMTEIVSGLNEGDYVVVKTVNSSAKTTTATSAKTTGNIGIPMMGGGRAR